MTAAFLLALVLLIVSAVVLGVSSEDARKAPVGQLCYVLLAVSAIFIFPGYLLWVWLR